MPSHMRLDDIFEVGPQSIGVGFMYAITHGVPFNFPLLVEAQGAPNSS